MSASLLVSCVGVATRSGLCPIAKETAEVAPTLCTEYGPTGWMDGNSSLFPELYLLLMEPVNVIGCSPFTFEKHVTMLVCMFCKGDHNACEM